MTLREFLRHFDFDYEIVENEYGEKVIKLIDLQGVNLRDIETEEFYSSLEVVDRLDIYYHDYIYEAICSEYGYKGEENYNELLKFAKQNNDVCVDIIYYIVNGDKLIVEDLRSDYYENLL